MIAATLLASVSGTIAVLIGIPVLVAALTAIATLLVTRAGDATDRRRDHYAEAIKTLVAWIEYPYRVRRRTDDTPETLSSLADLGHDLQERLACHEAWIATENPRVARAYSQTRISISQAVGPAIRDAWNSPPVAAPADMNLGDWGPGVEALTTIAELQRQIESRFGLRRLWRPGRVTEL